MVIALLTTVVSLVHGSAAVQELYLPGIQGGLVQPL